MDTFICGVCQKVFNHIVAFMEHKKDFPNSLSCGVCGSLFHVEHELADHNREHLGEDLHLDNVLNGATTGTSDAITSMEPSVEPSLDDTLPGSVTQISLDDCTNFSVVPGSDTEQALGNIHIVYESEDGMAISADHLTEFVSETPISEVESSSTDQAPVLLTVDNLSIINALTLQSVQSNITVESEKTLQVIAQENSATSLDEDAIAVCGQDEYIEKLSAPSATTLPCTQEEGDNSQMTLDSVSSASEKSPLFSGAIFACRLCNHFAFERDAILKHLTIVHQRCISNDSPDIDECIARLDPLQTADVGHKLAVHLVVTEPNQNITVDKQAHLPMPVDTGQPKRRRGRPRKTEQFQKKQQEVESRTEKQDNVLHRGPPVIGADGRYHCQQCKKSFNKERHILGHRCWGSSAQLGDYVDITKKIDFDNGHRVDESNRSVGPSEVEEDEEDVDTDLTEDYKVYLPGSVSRGRVWRSGGTQGSRRNLGQSTRSNLKSGECLSSDEPNLEEEMAAQELNEELESAPSTRPVVANGSYVPVFSTDEQRRAFEEKVNDIDLSCVDHLFMRHIVEQHTNDLAPKLAGREKVELELFTCNICKKVFKTLSHMRLHCLIHTDMKPFRCPECPYVSNAKGNLYTHMRKHTGNFFSCSVCNFRSCNRSHLAEHEATHNSVRHPCNLCGNDYNTLKSLVNHIRKYHQGTSEGRKYLASFLIKSTILPEERFGPLSISVSSSGAGTTAAVLHECHVCLRKFKKKVDRDRHLFVHNIRDSPHVLCCELCDYTASRRAYLENHFRKHRVVYVCCCCEERFLSTKRLKAHLSEQHLMTTKAANCIENGINSDLEFEVPFLQDGAQLEDLFNRSICLSWYLPEPESNIGTNQYLNMPNELLVIENNQHCQQEVGVPSVDITLSQGDQSSEGTLHSFHLSECHETGRNEAESPNVDESDMLVREESEEESTKLTFHRLLSLLQYKLMSVEIFKKIQQTFGQEECEFCGRFYHSWTDLEPHYRTHLENKPFKCPRCNYSSVTKDNLKRHVESVHDNKRFLCDQCGYVARSRTTMWHHQQKHKDIPIECPDCKKIFANRKKLRQHILCVHPQMDRLTARKLTGYSHRVQGRLGRRSFKCPYCERIFHRSSTDLQKHIWIHEGVKPYKCPLCTHMCRSRNNLNVHMLRHTSEKPHQCSQCGKAYKSRTALRWHVRSHSTGQQFACTRCDYTGTQKSHLKRHMETHEVVRRYACELCDYTCNTVGYMKVHFARKHKGAEGPTLRESGSDVGVSVTHPSETRAYECSNCDFIFGNLSDLRRHLKCKHHIILDNLQQHDIHLAEVTLQAEESILAPVVQEGGVHVVQLHAADADILSQIDPSVIQSLQGLQYATPSSGGDEGTVSAVNLIHQILEQSTLVGQQLSLDNLDGKSQMTLGPDTIILQQETDVENCNNDGEEVIVDSRSYNSPSEATLNYICSPDDGNNPSQVPTSQYFIQYVTQLPPSEDGDKRAEVVIDDSMVIVAAEELAEDETQPAAQ